MIWVATGSVVTGMQNPMTFRYWAVVSDERILVCKLSACSFGTKRSITMGLTSRKFPTGVGFLNFLIEIPVSGSVVFIICQLHKTSLVVINVTQTRKESNDRKEKL
jgi:hypothetical protein